MVRQEIGGGEERSEAVPEGQLAVENKRLHESSHFCSPLQALISDLAVQCASPFVFQIVLLPALCG